MADEAEAIIKSACIEAASQNWAVTTLTEGDSRVPEKIADNIAQLAALIFSAWKKHEPK
jgi:hypothetical protein